MKLTGQDIRHISTITHDGKVLLFGTAADGKMYYAVKRSGFEDTAIGSDNEPFGFEAWRALPLGESLDDPSVRAEEQETFTDTTGRLMLRSVYGAGDEVMKSVVAPMELVSALGHVYVFRQATTGKVLVTRFVLDGITNILIPKLDVRFRRSRQRLLDRRVTNGKAADSLDYRDMDGKPFYEPATELGFLGAVKEGWLSVTLVDTGENDVHRWHIAAVDAATGKLALWSVKASSDGLFDLQDYLFAEPGQDAESLPELRTISGIHRRTVEFAGLESAGKPALVRYANQREVETETGPRLLKVSNHVMLVAPVRSAAGAATTAATLCFTVGDDGLLSQIDLTPDELTTLRSRISEVLLPLNTLDDIKSLVPDPAPAGGAIARIAEGKDHCIEIRLAAPHQDRVRGGFSVAIKGTASYDGHYRVVGVEDAAFTVEAPFAGDQVGTWEVVTDDTSNLVFDNTVIGYARTADGKLRIDCTSHDLAAGDEVQITGMDSQDGVYPVKLIKDAESFLLDAPYAPAEILNLRRVKRRGVCFDGNDRLDTPPLGLGAFARDADAGRTVSAWVRRAAGASGEQIIAEDGGGALGLVVGADGKAAVRARMSDGAVRTVVDTAALPEDTWVHLAGVVDYKASAGGDTRVALYRDGAEAAATTVARRAPPHLGDKLLRFDGADDHVVVPATSASFAAGITVEAWAYLDSPGQASDSRAILSDTYVAGDPLQFTMHLSGADHKLCAGFCYNGAWSAIQSSAAFPVGRWVHAAATYDGRTLRVYLDGVEVGSANFNRPLPVDADAWRIGRRWDLGTPADMWKGHIADVRLWNKARAAADIRSDMFRRLSGREHGLCGIWGLDDGTAQDRCLLRRHGALTGSPVWGATSFLHPKAADASDASAYAVGAGFQGEIADLQIWREARGERDIADTRYLRLTGKEVGLAGYYRMGAVVHTVPAVVPDFSIHGKDAVVTGDPFAGSRRLDRAGPGGGKIYAYRCDALVEVAPRTTYEESFELKVQGAGGALDPNDIDGQGGKLFRFDYWGKESQAAGEVIPFPGSGVAQADFAALGGGWYRASCRFTVPDGVTVMRSFGVTDVKGRWGGTAAPPADEWTTADIRKHHLRRVSDAVTQEGYTDAITLASLAGPAAPSEGALAALRQAEDLVARYRAELLDLDARIQVVTNLSVYTGERDLLQNTTLPALRSQKTTAEGEKTALETRFDSYTCKFRFCHSNRYVQPYLGGNDNGNLLRQYDWQAVDYQIWEMVPVETTGGVTYYKIVNKQSGKAVMSNGGGTSDGTQVVLGDYTGADHQKWQLYTTDSLSSWYSNELGVRFYFKIKPASKEWNLWGGYTENDRGINLYSHYTHECMQLTLHRTALTSTAASAIQTKTSQITALANEIAAKEARVNELNTYLATTDTLATLQANRATAVTSLTSAEASLATHHNAVQGALGAAEPLSLPAIGEDRRGLRTTGAALDFVRPVGPLGASETCEGNVLLGYVDPQGEPRLASYDATQDARNSAFEQWLPPEPARTAADFRTASAVMTLAQPVELPETGWTVEGWFHYPLPTKSDGSAYPVQVLADGGGGTIQVKPLVIARGDRLGMLLDGFFLDAGVSLKIRLSPGWHHVAAVAKGGGAEMFLDGELAGRISEFHTAMTFDGVTTHVALPSMNVSFAQGLTVEAWVRAEHQVDGQALSDPKQTLVELGNGASDNDSIYLYLGSSNRLGLMIRRGTTSYSILADATTAAIGEWVHVAATVNAQGFCALYRNGVLIKSASLQLPLDVVRPASFLGKSWSSGRLRFKGRMSNVRLWTKALGESELASGMYASLKGDESGLSRSWSMRVDLTTIPSTVPEQSSARAHGTVQGNVPFFWNNGVSVARQVTGIGNALSGGSPAGMLANMRVWHAPLTGAELAYHARRQVSGFEPDLAAAWALDERAGTTAVDRSPAQRHGTLSGAGRVVATAVMGRPSVKTLSFAGVTGSRLACPAVNLANRSFTVEAWVRRGGNLSGAGIFFGQGSANVTNGGLQIGFRSSGKAVFAFWGNDLETTGTYVETDWHHWAFVYEHTTRTQTIYRDGVSVGTRVSTSAFTGSGDLQIGALSWSGSYAHTGDLAELRIWDRASTQAQIQAGMRERMTGAEAGLLALYPLDELVDGKVRELKTNALHGTATSVLVKRSTTLPLGAGDSLITAEYGSVEPAPDGTTQALMRRLLATTAGGAVHLQTEGRVEKLVLQWVGNAQLDPTLLGYIEGPPPVPSENLTVEEDYAGAVSVHLSQSSEVSYSWQRSEATSIGVHLEMLAGVGWGLEGGVGVVTKISEGKAGLAGEFTHDKTRTNETAVSATSTITMSDSLALVGAAESEPSLRHLGPRYIPKNVGYALVVSGLADVFVTKLARSGRMVSYEVRPVADMPLDVNTITFLINPTYTLNGSLDGQVGTAPADPELYGHVPEMRAQYGAIYPASYLRLEEAYALRGQIERMDKARETFFYNFDAGNLDRLDEQAEPEAIDMPGAPGAPSSGGAAGSGDAAQSATADSQAQAATMRSDSDKRTASMSERYGDIRDLMRAGSAFSDWQRRMEDIQLRCGKRNIVNVYVWDADGGLRAEEESFASTIEHSVGTQISNSGGLGGALESVSAGFALDLKAMGTGGKVDANSKTLGTSKSLSLTVDLSGMKGTNVTDAKDRPIMPGEKVDRYRFMTFFLEGSTQHFHDFFRRVVDPVWLTSNDEEARALRQVRAGTPNKCWRVLHRVTYVERPALMVVGKDIRVLQAEEGSSRRYMGPLKDIQQRTNVLEKKLDDVLAALAALSAPST